jgi:transcriptional regulator with XRE-family HTH domain
MRGVTMTNKEIGNRIKQAREELGLTKKDVASAIRVADSTIKRYEDGEIDKIKMPVIESIANVLKVNPMWIIGKSDSVETLDGKKELLLEDAYFSFAKEMQEKQVSEADMKKLWEFYRMIKDK